MEMDSIHYDSLISREIPLSFSPATMAEGDFRRCGHGGEGKVIAGRAEPAFPLSRVGRAESQPVRNQLRLQCRWIFFRPSRRWLAPRLIQSICQMASISLLSYMALIP